MNKISLTTFCFLGAFSILHANTGLDYLNIQRTKAGMPIFTEQSELKAAAENHSAYMQRNNKAGHHEESTLPGFTGVDASARTTYAGYGTVIVSENVSYDNDTTVKDSIDGLMSAIYHRFAFLSLNWDEAGIGIDNNKEYYTYNMGNKTLNGYCTSSSYSSSSGYLLRRNSKKVVAKKDYDDMSNSIKAYSPDIIIEIPRISCGLFDFHLANELIELGKNVARKVLKI